MSTENSHAGSPTDGIGPTRIGRMLSSVGTPVIAVGIRVLTVVCGWVIVQTTALSVIPNLGVYVQRSTHLTADATVQAQIVFGLMPLLFFFVIVAAIEISLLRAMWGAGTRQIRRIRESREKTTATTTLQVATPALGQAKRKRRTA